MKAVVYKEKGVFSLEERPRPSLRDPKDAIVKITLCSICSSDIHIKHGSVPRAVPGTIVGHEMVGEVVETGSAVTKCRPGDRVAVNVETFCGECFSVKGASSITVRMNTAAGRWGAGLTEDRRST